MKCQITCHGKTLTVEAQEDQSLLEVAIIAGVEPPYSCLEGVCGTCEALLENGEVISPFEIDKDAKVKTCMSRPTSDVKINYDKA